MNRIDTYAGGQHFIRQDFDFLQGAIRDAFIGLSKIYGDSYILSGCLIVPDGGDTDPVKCSEGYIVYKGEIMYIPEHEAASQLDDLISPHFVPFEDVDYSDTLESGPSKDTRIIRQARLVPESLAGVDKAPYKNMIINRDNTQFFLANGWGEGVNPVPTPMYRVEHKRVFLYGDIKFNTDIPGTNAPFTQFEEGLRPKENLNFIVLTSNGLSGSDYVSTPNYTWVRVDTNGRCWADPNVGTATSINLTGISWQANQ